MAGNCLIQVGDRQTWCEWYILLHLPPMGFTLSIQKAVLGICYYFEHIQYFWTVSSWSMNSAKALTSLQNFHPSQLHILVKSQSQQNFRDLHSSPLTNVLCSRVYDSLSETKMSNVLGCCLYSSEGTKPFYWNPFVVKEKKYSHLFQRKRFEMINWSLMQCE